MYDNKKWALIVSIIIGVFTFISCAIAALILINLDKDAYIQGFIQGAGSSSSDTVALAESTFAVIVAFGYVALVMGVASLILSLFVLLVGLGKIGRNNSPKAFAIIGVFQIVVGGLISGVFTIIGRNSLLRN